MVQNSVATISFILKEMDLKMVLEVGGTFARIRLLARGLTAGHQGRVSWLLLLVRKGGTCENWQHMENYLD